VIYSSPRTGYRKLCREQTVTDVTSGEVQTVVQAGCFGSGSAVTKASVDWHVYTVCMW
jgi:hypothetical protein